MELANSMSPDFYQDGDSWAQPVRFWESERAAQQDDTNCRS